MITITLHCPHCQSDTLVRNGHAPNGKQLYRCCACGRQSRENPTPHASSEARREVILHTYQERSSLRGLTRTFGVSRTTVSSWIKKSSSASSFVDNSTHPGPGRSHFHHPGTG
jgi:transposase-like protein